MHHPGRAAFDATGSLYREGRWHSVGTVVLYAAENISLAALETLIYSSGRAIPPRSLTTIHIPDHLSIEWASWLEKPASQAYGDTWVRETRSLLLRVPSIAADKMEYNYVINPAHPDFRLLAAGEAKPFRFDPRFIHFD